MPSFADIFSAVFLLTLAVAFVYGSHYVRSMFDQTVKETKTTMEKSGINYDAKRGGLDIKTDRRAPDREGYVTATSQAMLHSSKRLAKSGAATFGLSNVGGKAEDGAGANGKKHK